MNASTTVGLQPGDTVHGATSAVYVTEPTYGYRLWIHVFSDSVEVARELARALIAVADAVEGVAS